MNFILKCKNKKQIKKKCVIAKPTRYKIFSCYNIEGKKEFIKNRTQKKEINGLSYRDTSTSRGINRNNTVQMISMEKWRRIHCEMDESKPSG